jgi:hypothetical protein
MSFAMATGKPSSGTSITIVVNSLQLTWKGCYFTYTQICMPVATSKLAGGVFISTPTIRD